MLEEVYITGSMANQATEELQKSTSLTLSRDSETGKISATGEAKTKSDEKLAEAINSTSVKVNVTAENTSTTTSKGSYVGGAFMGNTVTNGANGNTVVAEQEVNPTVLGKMSSAHGKPGADMLHEVTEGFEGALISQKKGVSSPASNTAGSVYEKAHSRATKQSGNVYETVYDGSGKVIQSTDPNARMVQWHVIGKNRKEIVIQTIK